MTYAESYLLMGDNEFRGRIQVAALKYADSILNESSTIAGHTSRFRWALQCVQSPAQMAAQLQPPTVMDSAVQDAGGDVSDAALQGAVETVVNKTL